MKTPQPTKKNKPQQEYWHLCEECGDKQYPQVDKSKWTGITVMAGKCPVCKKQATLIPVADWDGYGD